MNKLFKLLKSQSLLKITAVIALIIYGVLIVMYKNKIGFSFRNNDNYAGAFNVFLEQSNYDAIANGTSIIYNLILKVINYITGDVNTSFVILNTFSHLFLIVFGYYLLKKVGFKKDMHFYLIVGFYVLYQINQNYYISASNDTFLAVFTLLLFNLLIFKIYEKKHLNYCFFFIGVLLAIAFAIRPTAIYLVPITIYSLVIWFIKTPIKKSNKFFKIVLVFLSFILLTACFHYPSIKENSKLSFHDKRPKDINENWVQRNYLGWKKIEEGKHSMNRDAIWVHTGFKDVRNYLNEHGEDSLPRTFTGVLKKDPILFTKIAAYNVSYSLFRFLRFWGFLLVFLLLPFFKLKKENLLSKSFLSSSIFTGAIVMICFTCLTFVEERWFIAFEILIPLSILFYLKNKKYDKNVLNMVISLSMILVSIMNLRSILSYI